MTKTTEDKKIQRPPVVVVMGHIDHGKSTLLDYIRKSNVVAHEAGGITQHTAAYEVDWKDASGKGTRITFIDTPGHAAFAGQRARGARVADIAILVVSAEDGVKAQTLEAFTAITGSGIPYIVAINKTDRPSANVEKTISSLTENGIYLEGRGGSVSYVPISAKTGEGVSDLLDMIVLTAELEELTADPHAPASGVVIESHVDEKKGVSGTLIVQNGTLAMGMAVAAGGAYAPVRIMEDHAGTPIKNASFSSPVRILGWSELPPVGEPFVAFEKKRDAENTAREYSQKTKSVGAMSLEEDGDAVHLAVPLVIKADAAGTIEAILHELPALENDRTSFKVLHTGIGTISEGDVKIAGGDTNVVIVGFNVKIDGRARDLIDRAELNAQTFTIIYELTEWLKNIADTRRPSVETEEDRGRLKVLRAFSATKRARVIGGRVEEGTFSLGATVHILRRENDIGTGIVKELQVNRADVKEVATGSECGLKVDTKVDIAPGDILVARVRVQR